MIYELQSQKFPRNEDDQKDPKVSRHMNYIAHAAEFKFWSSAMPMNYSLHNVSCLRLRDIETTLN